MEILLFQARKERKESRWKGVIGNVDRKLRRGRAEIRRDLGAERFKTLRGGKEQKSLPYRGGAPRTLGTR